MALSFPVLFGGQIYLYVTNMCATSQVILTNQTIKIDRRSRACIGLVVFNFRNG